MMTKCFCDICGKEIKDYHMLGIRDIWGDLVDKDACWGICSDCEQAIRAYIGNRRAKAGSKTDE